MRRRLVSLGLLAAALLSGAGLSSGGAAAAAEPARITVLNPAVTAQFADRVPLAPRLDTLDGKTLYLVDTNWGGFGNNDLLLKEMQAWFATNLPRVTTVLKVKQGNFVTDDPALWREIAEARADGVIIGVAG
ncbi:MAG: hypothetical protein IT494_01450 [Gammaproteobacteria bacterium]|nr:hypothetical protein [Gammaproteobacteria bacterium]